MRSLLPLCVLLWALLLGITLGFQRTMGAGVKWRNTDSRKLTAKSMAGRSSAVAVLETPVSLKSATNSSSSSSYEMLLFQKLESYCSKEDQELVKRAFHFSRRQLHERNHHHHKESRMDDENNNVFSSWNHTVGVAHVLADMKLDAACLVTGLLEPCIMAAEDSHESHNSHYSRILLQEIQGNFGVDIRRLVEGANKIGRIIRYRGGASQESNDQNTFQLENYRKMIVAMANDIRVVLVKLADQTQTVRTLHTMDSSSKQQQKAIAQETIDLFAPLAHRLGLYTLKTELEDTALRFSKPDEYRNLQSLISARNEQRQKYTDSVIEILSQQVKEVDESSSSKAAVVTGRAKTIYSIYNKMQSQNLAFGDIQDLAAFRILVDDISQCYQALGIVTSRWEPIPGRFKDYIASPKPNGYQSLHSTVVGPEGKRIEVQIRTHEMHEIAEGGVAAHWMYKGKVKKGSQDEAQRYKWLRQLIEWIQTDDDDDDATEQQQQPSSERKGSSNNNKEETGLLDKEVFVFSPQGQLFAMAKGSSVLDFAYRIHSNVGDHCAGAKVDGRMVSLKHKLNNGETIEIMTSANQSPRREWLNMVETTKAKSRIKAWLRKQQRSEDESAALRGRELLDKAVKKQQTVKRLQGTDGVQAYKESLDDVLAKFKVDDEQDLLTALSLGQIGVSSVVNEIISITTSRKAARSPADDTDDEVLLKTLKDNESSSQKAAPRTDGIVVGGKRNMLISFCRNCNALYGEEVQGVVTQGRGVKVHRLDCKYLHESDEQRRVPASWDETAKSVLRTTNVEVVCEDSPGVLASMSKAISSCNIYIGSVSLRKLPDGRELARFGLMLSSIDDLNRVRSALQQEKRVLDFKRK